MWYKGVGLLGNCSWELTTIHQVVEKWTEKEFHNNILNRIWELFPNFVLWETWKERNTRIFEGRARKPEEAWTRIYAHIKETLGLSKWDAQGLKAGLEETRILRNWEITSIP